MAATGQASTTDSAAKVTPSPANTLNLTSLRTRHETALVDNAELAVFLSELSSQCHGIMRYFSIGHSVEGRDIWVARLTDNPDVVEDEPEVLWLGNIHGDETLGRQLLIHLVLDICDRYAAGDHYIRWLVEETDIFVMFSANPDGFHALQRRNHHNVDLNRNFPDQVRASGTPLQRETRAIMAFLNKHSFSLGATFHGGDLVCNYPWDGNSIGRVSFNLPSYSPDDALFQKLCKAYSSNHAYMHLSQKFPDGITDGSAWYSMFGGLQDYCYAMLGMLHVTLEIGYAKNPPVSMIASEWKENSKAMYAFMEQVHTGVRGRVTCECGALDGQKRSFPARAKLSFKAERGIGLPVAPLPLAQVIYTRTQSGLGDYHRPLLPGSYIATIEGCDGSVLPGQRVVVPNRTVADDPSTAAIYNFSLWQARCPRSKLEKETDLSVKAESRSLPNLRPSRFGQGLLFPRSVPLCAGIIALPLAVIFLLRLGRRSVQRQREAAGGETEGLL